MENFFQFNRDIGRYGQTFNSLHWSQQSWISIQFNCKAKPRNILVEFLWTKLATTPEYFDWIRENETHSLSFEEHHYRSIHRAPIHYTQRTRTRIWLVLATLMIHKHTSAKHQFRDTIIPPHFRSAKQELNSVLPYEYRKARRNRDSVRQIKIKRKNEIVLWRKKRMK